MRRRYPKAALPPVQLLLAWQSASLLLDYPDEELLGRLGVLREAAGRLPEHVGAPLRAVVDHLEATPLDEVQADYVETFDTRRRCNLFLTYFAHGDTRKRGMALLRFKQAYLRSGFVLGEEELPDHLCVVLEYAGTVDQELGRRLILDHRAGLELLRLALRDRRSPWAPVLDAVCATLPPLQGDEMAAVRRLAAQGPPEEEVGLDPYVTAELDPAVANAAGRRQPLPTPTMPGAR